MYKKVETTEDLNIFDNIWMSCWVEKGYEMEFSYGDIDRYIIKNDESQNIGTVELKDYSLNENNPMNLIYPFHKNNVIATSTKRMVEVDKVAILREHRGKNLDRLLSVIVFHCKNNEISYCIVLLERLFYKALRNVYKVPLYVDGDKFFYKGDMVVPAIIDVEKMYRNSEEYNWLISDVEKAGLEVKI